MTKTKRSTKWVKEFKRPCQTIKVLQGKQQYAGIHLIVEFWHGKIVDDSKKIEQILLTAVEKANSTPLDLTMYKFEPQGITGVVLLAESHIAIHTWPEIGYIAIDIFTCGDQTVPYKALDYFKEVFEPKKVEVKEVKRGKLNGRSRF